MRLAAQGAIGVLRRCSQLIGNALRSNTDNYYVDDDELEIALDEYPGRCPGAQDN